MMTAKREEKDMVSGYKTAIEVSIEDIKDDIADIKEVLKGLTTAVSTLAVQEERQGRMQQDIDKILQSIDAQWKAIRSIQDTCRIREKHVEFAEGLMQKPDSQSWWNAKVTGAAEKLFLLSAGAIASAIGYQVYLVIVDSLKRQ